MDTPGDSSIMSNSIEIKDITMIDGYWYVATPYSKYGDGIDIAFEDACLATAFLINKGLNAFSPIVHSHPLCTVGGLNPFDFKLWMKVDKELMDGAAGLIVIEMDGWKESVGVQEEIQEFKKQDKAIYYLGESGGKLHDQPSS